MILYQPKKRSVLVHDRDNIEQMLFGYEEVKKMKDPDKAERCREVIRMIDNGTLKTKAQVDAERKKRGIERR